MLIPSTQYKVSISLFREGRKLRMCDSSANVDANSANAADWCVWSSGESRYSLLFLWAVTYKEAIDRIVMSSLWCMLFVISFVTSWHFTVRKGEIFSGKRPSWVMYEMGRLTKRSMRSGTRCSFMLEEQINVGCIGISPCNSPCIHFTLCIDIYFHHIWFSVNAKERPVVGFVAQQRKYTWRQAAGGEGRSFGQVWN